MNETAEKPTSMKPWLLLMVTTGFCSMVYELALAQLLTGLLGGALARFATTIGVYIVGLGIGSMSFRGTDDERDGKLFFAAECGLFLLGLLSPFLFVASYRIAFSLTGDPGSQTTLVLLLTHVVIFATGFLSGLELPILSAIASRKRDQGDPNVLSADYFGMFLASLLFPFLLYPQFGLLPAFAIATFLNLCAATYTYWLIKGRGVVIYVLIGFFFIVNIAALVLSSTLQTWLSDLYATTT